MLTPLTTAVLALAGVALDAALGEPRRGHPLVAFGSFANWLESRGNRRRPQSRSWRDPNALRVRWRDGNTANRAAGALAWSCAVLTPTALATWLTWALPGPLALALHMVLLWLALGARSLGDHVAPIAEALARNDLERARELTQRIVSRDLARADRGALARAAVESTLENGNDAIFGTLFWFVVAGGPGALAYRLANTLDAMWGYRNQRFLTFGHVAARADDAFNWVPARLTALSYAVLGDTRAAWRCWRRQARFWDSPNAGPVLAAGAGSLRLTLGGAACYDGVREERPVLGLGAAPEAADAADAPAVRAALRLVRRTLALWLIVLVLGATLIQVLL